MFTIILYIILKNEMSRFTQPREDLFRSAFFYLLELTLERRFSKDEKNDVHRHLIVDENKKEKFEDEKLRIKRLTTFFNSLFINYMIDNNDRKNLLKKIKQKCKDIEEQNIIENPD